MQNHKWGGDSEMSLAYSGIAGKKHERKSRFYYLCDGINLLMVSKWVMEPLVIGIFISSDIV